MDITMSSFRKKKNLLKALETKNTPQQKQW